MRAKRFSAKRDRAISLFFLGKDNKEIASALGVTPVTVASWSRDPEVQKELARLHEERQKKLERVFDSAVDLVASKICDEKDAKCAMEILRIYKPRVGKSTESERSESLADRLAGANKTVLRIAEGE